MSVSLHLKKLKPKYLQNMVLINLKVVKKEKHLNTE